MDTPSITTQRQASHRFAQRVRLGLVALFALLAVSDGVLLWLPGADRVDDVDVAGRQRMLSQRAARFTEALLADPEGSDVAEERVGLLETAQAMDDGMARLRGGDAARNDAAVRALYEGSGGVAQGVARFTAAARSVARTEPHLLHRDDRDVQLLTQEVEPLLTRLDAATQAHEASARTRNLRVQWTSHAFTLAELFAVVLAWLVGFRPLMAMLREESEALEDWEVRNRDAGEARAFEGSLQRALEMAHTEPQVLEVASRALALVDVERPSEMLLADNSRAHLRVGAVDAALGRAGCHAPAPYECPAMRQGRTLQFRSSDDLDACPHLRGRGRACSGTCTPVTFMGQALGVLHQVGDDGTLLSKPRVKRLTTLAAQVGTRLGTVQSFAQVEQQAHTDPLTGLMNRRAFEEAMRRLIASGLPYSISVADLDHFKSLNDTYGHDAGDRALRTFAKVAQASCRADDLLCRWGGEEFVFVWPDARLDDARACLDRLRGELARVNDLQPEHPSFTGSFGLADQSAGADWREALAVADAALLHAKDAGRDRVVAHVDVDSDEAVEGLRVAN